MGIFDFAFNSLDFFGITLIFPCQEIKAVYFDFMGKLEMFGSKTNSIKAEYNKFRKKN